MRKSRFAVIGALGIATALALTACAGSGSGSSGDNGSSNDGTIPKVDGSGETLTVWAMNGDLTPESLAAINKQFKEETGAKVKLEMQQWDGITTKVTTALATSTPPDIIDIGNTQTPGYASNGGMLDVTDYKKALQQGQTWLAGLEDPGTVDGKLYGIPAFAATRAAIYNKALWAKAGVTEAPTTYDQLTADLDKIKAANTAKDFSAFYLPGQYWYAGLQWVWDAGGDIASQKGSDWKGGFSSSEAQAGLTAWKDFQNAYSTSASRTLDTDKPDQDQVFADGHAATILANAWEIGSITKANPKLTEDKLGSFPMPGKSGKNQPALLAGSNWSIAAKSKHKDLALVWAKIAVSPEVQNKWVFGNDKWIPNSVEGSKKALDSGNVAEIQKAFFTAAQVSKSTPAAAKWSTVEGDKSINQFFSSIASGTKSPADAAKTFDASIEKTLNG